jgi:hypothetical protein
MSDGAERAPAARSLRERPAGKLLALLAVLFAAFLVSRGCASSGRNVSKEEAIRIARKQLDFRPRCAQVRYLRQGIKSQPVWAVSLWTLKAGQFDRVGLVLVAARDGRVISVTRRPDVAGTAPQCESPV